MYSANFYSSTEVPECDEIITERKMKKSKVPSKKRNNDEFYFKHKKYGKNISKYYKALSIFVLPVISFQSIFLIKFPDAD